MEIKLIFKTLPSPWLKLVNFILYMEIKVQVFLKKMLDV